MAAYRYTYDETYNLQAARRLNSRRFARYFGVAFLATLGLAFFVFAGAMWDMERRWLPATLAAVFALLVLFGRPIDAWLLKRRLRKSPFWKEQIEMTLTPEGFQSVSSKDRYRVDWRVFVKARRVRDGFLLYEFSKAVYWLPDYSLVEGTVEDVEALFREYIRDYKPMRTGNR